MSVLFPLTMLKYWTTLQNVSLLCSASKWTFCHRISSFKNEKLGDLIPLVDAWWVRGTMCFPSHWNFHQDMWLWAGSWWDLQVPTNWVHTPVAVIWLFQEYLALFCPLSLLLVLCFLPSLTLINYNISWQPPVWWDALNNSVTPPWSVMISNV